MAQWTHVGRGALCLWALLQGAVLFGASSADGTGRGQQASPEDCPIQVEHIPLPEALRGEAVMGGDLDSRSGYACMLGKSDDVWVFDVRRQVVVAHWVLPSGAKGVGGTSSERRTVRVVPGGERFLVLSRDGGGSVLGIDGHLDMSFPVEPEPIFSHEWVLSPSGRFLVEVRSGGGPEKGGFRIYSLDTHALIKTVPSAPTSYLSASWSSSGSFLALGMGDGRIEVYESASWRRVAAVRTTLEVDSPDLKFGWADQFLMATVWEPDTGAWPLPRIFRGRDRGEVRVWAIKNGALKPQKSERSTKPIGRRCLDSSGRFWWDCPFKADSGVLEDLQSGREIRMKWAKGERYDAMAASPDGRWILRKRIIEAPGHVIRTVDECWDSMSGRVQEISLPQGAFRFDSERGECWIQENQSCVLPLTRVIWNAGAVK